MRRACVSSLIILSLILTALPASAAPGDYDTTFGREGFAQHPATTTFTSARDVTALADGRLVEVGFLESESQPTVQTAAATFTANGEPTGAAFTNAAGVLNAWRAIVPYPGGRAVTVGWAIRCLDPEPGGCGEFSRELFLVARHLPDGSPDRSFDDDGVALTPMGAAGAVAEGVAVQPDGAIVVVGTARDRAGGPRMAVARYLPNGSLDRSFGNRGRLLLRGGSAADVIVTPTGKLVVAGTDSGRFVVLRRLPGGAPDAAFGQGGQVEAGFRGRAASATDVALASGKILVGGSVTPSGAGTPTGFALMRFTPAGALDTAFHADGRVRTMFAEGSAGIEELAVTASGKIVAGGGPGVARYTPAGSLDPTFGGDGRIWLTHRFYGVLNVEGLVRQGSKIVLAFDTGDVMALTRLLL